MQRQYISFAGNIAVGKTSAATALAAALSLPLVTESVAANPFLERFYEHPDKWAFRLQMFNIADRARSILDAPASFVLDRSFEEDGIYVDVALSLGYISKEEHAVYHRLFAITQRSLPVPSLLIYLRVDDVSQLAARIARRSRPGEVAISINYLADLNTRYDEWFESYASPKQLVNVAGLSDRLIKEAVVAAAAN